MSRIRNIWILTVGMAVLPSGWATSAKRLEPELKKEDREHWAFQPVKRYDPPVVENVAQVRNGIDSFILAQLEQSGLTLQPAADRRTLIRRLSFDLRGLPPSIEEVDAFIADHSDRAYSDLIDRFLASPAYGERWGQHWLDVVRFAESDGFEHDFVRKEAWRYRDWVIRSLNDDMPYDQFLAMQIAADELYPGSDDKKIATGFLVAGPDMPDINLPEERAHTVLNEMTSTTGLVFMGLTLGCAQCHDHKSDPVSQADFYRLRAVFANMDFPEKNKQLNHTFIESDASAPPSYFMERGDFRRPSVEVAPAFVRVVNLKEAKISGNAEGKATTGRRKALAEWLTDAAHPLTSRVIVNRLWQHHFGKPIVGTPNDFGILGDRPSHPELLDWLASEIVARNWSLKEMHRLMLLSSTYRQSSRQTDSSWERVIRVDPQNRLFSRMGRKRMEGEAIRDAMLTFSGQLNPKMGGPSVHPPLPPEVAITLLKKQWEVSEDESDHYRRSIYLFTRRNLRFPIFDVFDRPDANASCGRRNVSTTAPQSLTLLNSEFSLQSAQRTAGSILESGAAEYGDWVKLCYQRLFSRPESSEELEAGIAFLKEQSEMLRGENRDPAELAIPKGSFHQTDPYRGAALTDYCLALFNLNEMLYLD
jgi:hypothetical protein